MSPGTRAPGRPLAGPARPGPYGDQRPRTGSFMPRRLDTGMLRQRLRGPLVDRAFSPRYMRCHRDLVRLLVVPIDGLAETCRRGVLPTPEEARP